MAPSQFSENIFSVSTAGQRSENYESCFPVRVSRNEFPKTNVRPEILVGAMVIIQEPSKGFLVAKMYAFLGCGAVNPKHILLGPICFGIFCFLGRA